MGWESFGVVGFDLGLLILGQTRIAKPKSAHNSLITGPRGLQCETNLRKSWVGNLLILSDLIAKLKSAYNSLIIDPRGLGW